MNASLRATLLAACLVLAPFVADAGNYSFGALRIDHPWSRPTPSGAPTAGGYLAITNTGPLPDRLLGGSSPLVTRIEVHQMTMDNGIMRMRALPDGLSLPPHATVKLEPGAFHLMLIGPRQPFRIGDHVPVTLRFARAGAVRVEFIVQIDGENGMGGMSGMSR